jgi:anti-sigma regulatory factor (Ser/Thr protein kinase)
METLRLLVTELVANSVRHAAGRAVELKVIVTKGAVLTEVGDAGPGFAPATEARRSAQEEDRGWGLFLVRRLADRWGVRREDNRTSVWFELRRVR